MGSVHVTAEMHGEISLAVGLQGLADHDRSQVRSTDTNVDDGVDGLSGMSLPVTRAHFLRESLDSERTRMFRRN